MEYFKWLVPACCCALGSVAELGDQDEAAGERPVFVIEVVGRNKSLLAELAFSGAAEPVATDKGAAAGEGAAKDDHRDDHPVYRFWHRHISTLIAAQRPDVDAEMIAHVLLGALHSEPILACLAADGPARPAAAVRTLARAILDAPS